MKAVYFLKRNVFELILLFLFALFSVLLMWKTFQYSRGEIHIASRAWSDFAATIPLIRSFSYGTNFPPEYPIFSGYPIRYHFIFYMFVGTLERIGVPLDWALNLPSAIGFLLLLYAIYFFTRNVFVSRLAGAISTVLFLFNGSMGFLEFFKRNPPSLNTITDIIQSNQFTSFGPYDGKLVSAFWSLNIFTNQRHLALAYACYLLFFLFVVISSRKPKSFTHTKAVFLGIFIGSFPFIHLAVFGMMGITLLVLFILYPKIRLKLLITGITALLLATPQYLYMGKVQIETTLFNPGYLVEKLNLTNFTVYWFFNLGLTAFFAPIGFLLANKSQRKIVVPFIVLFILGNLLQFTPEIAANHKFFNLSVIGLNMFTAYFLTVIWRKKILGKFAVFLMLIPLTLTGIIDLFPIANDNRLVLEDIPKNETATFIYKNTPSDSIFLNSSFLYDPASIAGRKLFMGWPYFSWSAGYDTNKRYEEMKELFDPHSLSVVCSTLEKHNISYISVFDPLKNNDFVINPVFFNNNFTNIYTDKYGTYKIYEVGNSCL